VCVQFLNQFTDLIIGAATSIHACASQIVVRAQQTVLLNASDPTTAMNASVRWLAGVAIAPML
jgi:hypothetical protein